MNKRPAKTIGTQEWMEIAARTEAHGGVLYHLCDISCASARQMSLPQTALLRNSSTLLGIQIHSTESEPNKPATSTYEQQRLTQTFTGNNHDYSQYQSCSRKER